MYMQEKTHHFQLIFTFLFILPLVVGCAHHNEAVSQSNSCFSTLWPHEKSELQPDPSLVYGKLDNGFRYVIKNNDNPKDRAALYLNVQAGSIYENEDERGYAHFLEHMLFNGTTNFPPGALIDYFQAIGMSFGADTNAHTSYDETVYKIQLPQSNIDEIKKGLLVMSDYASGALLLEEEVERERPIILAEKASRDSVRYRTHLAKNEKAFMGTLLAKRPPIGDRAVITSAQNTDLREFYHKWYRPENMVLVAVGDFDIADVKREIISSFSAFQPVGNQPPCPSLGELQEDNFTPFYSYEPNMGSVKVALES